MRSIIVHSSSTNFIPLLRTIPQQEEDEALDVEDQLWVDRYRPKKFTDLLGNERVARDAMAWLKQWDWCVFGRSRKGKKVSDKDAEGGYVDEYHRPREKVRPVHNRLHEAHVAFSSFFSRVHLV